MSGIIPPPSSPVSSISRIHAADQAAGPVGSNTPAFAQLAVVLQSLQRLGSPPPGPGSNSNPSSPCR